MKKLVRKEQIIPIFVAILIFLLAFSLLFFSEKLILFAPGELSVERNLPDSATLNQQFIVTLQVYTAADKPAAIGITEIVPASWIIGNITNADYFKINNNIIEILLFSTTNNIDDTTITYTITPTNTTSSIFSGTWESVGPGDQSYSGDVQGDTSLTINTGSGGSSPGGGGGATTPTQSRTNQTCQENWLCSAWNECENKKQTRTCTDMNLCGTITDKPLESTSCNPVIKATEQTIDYSKKHPALPVSAGLIISIIIIVIMIITIITTRKKLAKIMPYIQKAKKQGYTTEQIKESLRRKGYPRKIIKKLNKFIK